MYHVVFSSLMLLVGQQEGHPEKTEWWDAGMVMYLGQGADLHMAQLMPLLLTISCSSKSRLVVPFWYLVTQVVPDKIQKSSKTIVCVCALCITYNDERLLLCGCIKWQQTCWGWAAGVQ